MPLPTVSGAQIRGSTYHLNLPIPKVIQSLYPEHKSGVMRGSLRTADPKEAKSRVGEQRAIFDRQAKEAQRLADRERILGTLGQEDRDLLAEIGGPERLLDTIRELRKEAALALAGMGSGAALATETESLPPHALRTLAQREEQEGQAALRTLTAETRRLKGVSRQLGKEPPAAPSGLDEGTVGIRELAEKFTDANSYTIQNKESVLHTVRRWIELHGDIPVEKWTRAHLDKFDEVLTKFPASTAASLRSLPLLKIISKGQRENLPTISKKTRARYSDHMKSLSKYALNQAGLISADPFAGYKPRGEKVKFSAGSVKETIPFTPAQVGKILDHVEKTDGEVIDRWLPLLAAYTGARREELGQLLVTNVRLSGNVHVIEISDDDPQQKVKNKHSVRVVPLPSPVIAAGFLDYVERRKASGGHFLFLEDQQDKRRRVTRGEVTPDRRGRFTERYGERFRRKVRVPCELTEPGMKFHSLRHSWTDAARRAGIDKEIRRLIAGRLDGEDFVEAGYGGDDLLGEKLAALEKVASFVRD
ncbi:hypothetical protein B6V74_12910 [Thioclava sp. F42-5]|uniref:site-specific integrase n=1 Tax=Thioclava sp. F42-5 TaxID=1973005 RepID=UPI000B53E7E0|nr:site-specific integrase [Thioclava sp. F42-5]OWY08720.1 hypothetical protein B6V74_12910 [Thioclava sp. F42-5]